MKSSVGSWRPAWSKLVASLFGLCLVTSLARGQERDARVDSLISQVSIDSLLHSVRALSGEIPVVVDDTTYVIGNRIFDSQANSVATKWIGQQLLRWGLEVDIDRDAPAPFEESENVIARIVGSVEPDKSYILGAHYDAVAGAPGADDNASGTSAVLEAARVMSQLETHYTVLFAFWDAEEIGLEGSRMHAEHADTTGMEILGVINLDMIAWDEDGDARFEIHSSDVANSRSLASAVEEVVGKYGVQLVPTVANPGTGRSDHRSFWDIGVGAILLIEEFYGGDFNAYYHSSNDRVEHFNVTYYEEMSRLAVASIAALSLKDNVSIGTEKSGLQSSATSLDQNYPNPFWSQTQISFTLSRSSWTRLEVFDVMGREIERLVDGALPAGPHTATWSGRDYPAGVYFYRLEADGRTELRPMVKVD